MNQEQLSAKTPCPVAVSVAIECPKLPLSAESGDAAICLSVADSADQFVSSNADTLLQEIATFRQNIAAERSAFKEYQRKLNDGLIVRPNDEQRPSDDEENSVLSSTLLLEASSSQSSLSLLEVPLHFPHTSTINFVIEKYGPRLLGEVAYQLERRVIVHVLCPTRRVCEFYNFPSERHFIQPNGSGCNANVRRFYGYSLVTLNKLIKLELALSVGKYEDLIAAGNEIDLRQANVDNHLRCATGFELPDVGTTTFMLVNRFGLLEEEQYSSVKTDDVVNNGWTVKMALLQLAPESTFKNISTIVDALMYLASVDKEPLFCY